MLYSIKIIKDLDTLNKLASLQNQVEETRLHDKFCKQIFHEIIKKVFEPLNDTIKKLRKKQKR